MHWVRYGGCHSIVEGFVYIFLLLTDLGDRSAAMDIYHIARNTMDLFASIHHPCSVR